MVVVIIIIYYIYFILFIILYIILYLFYIIVQANSKAASNFLHVRPSITSRLVLGSLESFINPTIVRRLNYFVGKWSSSPVFMESTIPSPPNPPINVTGTDIQTLFKEAPLLKFHGLLEHVHIQISPVCNMSVPSLERTNGSLSGSLLSKSPSSPNGVPPMCPLFSLRLSSISIVLKSPVFPAPFQELIRNITNPATPLCGNNDTGHASSWETILEKNPKACAHDCLIEFASVSAEFVSKCSLNTTDNTTLPILLPSRVSLFFRQSVFSQIFHRKTAHRQLSLEVDLAILQVSTPAIHLLTDIISTFLSLR